MAFSTKISTSNQGLAKMTHILFRFFGHRLLSDCKQKLNIFLYGKTFTVLKKSGGDIPSCILILIVLEAMEQPSAGTCSIRTHEKGLGSEPASAERFSGCIFSSYLKL